jgi:hypothetical protein
MNERIDKLMYHAGLTAQGCWDEMDEYDRKAIEKFAELIIQDCMESVDGFTMGRTFETHYDAVQQIEALFGVKYERED